jgi:hypothetical protein
MDTPAITAELQNVFNILNKALFDEQLKLVPISIQTKKKVSLRYAPDMDAIIVGNEFSTLEYSEIPHVMLHEMIHIRNQQRGVVDVTANQYHNKQFLQVALEVGLVVIKHKTQGWAITSTVYPRNVVERQYIRKPSKEAVTRRDQAFAEIKPDKAIFKVARTELKERMKGEKPPKMYFLKYICNCPPPHNSIRSGRRPDGPNALNIMCMSCRSKFECVTETD